MFRYVRISKALDLFSCCPGVVIGAAGDDCALSEIDVVPVFVTLSFNCSLLSAAMALSPSAGVLESAPTVLTELDTCSGVFEGVMPGD